MKKDERGGSERHPERQIVLPLGECVFINPRLHAFVIIRLTSHTGTATLLGTVVDLSCACPAEEKFVDDWNGIWDRHI